MKKAPIVQKWFATNPTQYQKEIVQKWVRQVMILFFLMGFISCVILFLILGSVL